MAGRKSTIMPEPTWLSVGARSAQKAQSAICNLQWYKEHGMTRTRISLDGHWDFFADPQQRLAPQSLDHDGARRDIVVPGPWQAQLDDLRDYSGVAWYRRVFELTTDRGEAE